MNDQIETATQLSESGISFGPTGTTVITSLAIYGAMSLTRDVASLAKKIHRNRKAKKAAEQAETTPEQ